MRQATASTQDFNSKINDLRAKANDLKLKASDLEVKKQQLGDQRGRLSADISRAPIDKQIADVEHELTATRLQIESFGQQIGDLESERDMSRVFNLQGPATIATVPPPSDPRIQHEIEMERGAAVGGFILLLPLVLVLSRRLWHRGGPRRVEVEDSPRLQRMEQAIESIALEVERIGEAQRFTTKLLAERQPEAAQRVAVQARREPGVITPH